MKSKGLFVIMFFIGIQLSAQNGNVGIGIVSPQSKLHVDGDLQVEDMVTIKDTSSNSRFFFDPNAGIFQMLDGLGNAFFSFEFDDGTNNSKGNASSESRSGKNSFGWKYDNQTESMVQVFDSNGNGKLEETIIEGSELTIVTDKVFKDVNDVLRKEEISNPFETTELYYNSIGQLQAEVIMEKDGKTINFYDPPNATPSRQMKLQNQPFTYTLENENQEKGMFSPDQLKFETPDTNETSLGIGLLKIQENDNQAFLNEIGFQQFNLQDFSSLFIDKFGFSQFGTTSSDFIGFMMDPAENKMEVEGNLDVMEDLNVTGQKNFRIDHPLDPQNKFLYHSSVESPMPMNVYRGNTTTDANGKAIVELPDYFEALNIDYAYQLTVIGTFAQAIVAEEIQQNQFVIRTSEPHVKVSWQVTGQRNDPYHQDHPYHTVREKSGQDKGRLLYDPNRELPYAESMKSHFDRREQILRKR